MKKINDLFSLQETTSNELYNIIQQLVKENN